MVRYCPLHELEFLVRQSRTACSGTGASDDLTRVYLAFFHVTWIVSVALLAIGVIDLLT